MSQVITRDYQGHVFQFREDGYFNMTKAAKVFGKDLSNFMRSPEAADYIDALSKTVESTELVEAQRGRNGGTWGHPKLAVFFARWLDVKFAVFCDMVIDDIPRKKAELTITKPEESAVMSLPKSFSEALRLAAELEEQKEQLRLQNEAMRPHAVVGIAVGTPIGPPSWTSSRSSPASTRCRCRRPWLPSATSARRTATGRSITRRRGTSTRPSMAGLLGHHRDRKGPAADDPPVPGGRVPDAQRARPGGCRMNRFGLGERPWADVRAALHQEEGARQPLLTLAYLHYWDKGRRVPADMAARLIEEGYDVES